MYILGGTDLSIFDYTPIREGVSDIALSGHLDMPARIGDTFFSWGRDIGIEPYVSAGEIFFGGRDLRLIGVITGTDQNDCNGKLDALYALIDSFNGIVPFVTDFGTYQVYVNAAITGEYKATTVLKVTIAMREPIVALNGAIPASSNSEFGIDGIPFASFGAAYISLTGDRWNRPAAKKADVSVYGKEGYAITGTEARILSMRLAIKAANYIAMRNNVYGLMALFAAPGTRSLTVNNDKLREFFVKDGFKVSMIQAYGDYAACVIDVDLTEVGIGGIFTELADSLGNIITDNDGNTIMVRL
jgi:hypothetical protein